jgi:hypothetical protein
VRFEPTHLLGNVILFSGFKEFLQAWVFDELALGEVDENVRDLEDVMNVCLDACT